MNELQKRVLLKIHFYFSAHWDHRLKHEPEFDLNTGNRIATVLFYVRRDQKVLNYNDD